MTEATALHELARLGGAQDAVFRLQELAPHCDGGWLPAFVAHATGLAKDDGRALDAAADGFEPMGALLFAAECAAASSRAHARAGLRASATASAARAQVLAARCEGAITPALADLDVPADLSRREREVALLAADGLSNRDIADRLSVSVRTIEGHLYQVFAKLGVSRREDLPRVLRRT